MKKIIAFSVFGNHDIHNQGAIKNCILQKKFYPDWECVFYCSSDTDKTVIEKIQLFGGKVHIMNIDGGIRKGTIWRFLPFLNKENDIIIVRDADSRFNERELDAVNEWLESDKQFHFMRDHETHDEFLLSGMWGAKNYHIDITEKEFFEHYEKISNDKRGTCVRFLLNFLLPPMQELLPNSIIHDDLDRESLPRTHNYRIKLEDDLYIGQIIDIDEKPLTHNNRMEKYKI